MPMRLPINTDGLTIIAAGYEAALKDRNTGEIATDRETGQPLYNVYLTVFTSGDVRPQIWQVKVAGEPKGLAQGQFVRVSGLIASDWERDGRHGISLRAGAIVPAVTSAKQAAA